VLNGVKQFITSGKNGDVAIVMAVTDKAAGKKGISAFIVPTRTPGYTVARLEDKMGQHASDTAQIVFENCRVPAANRWRRRAGPEDRAVGAGGRAHRHRQPGGGHGARGLRGGAGLQQGPQSFGQPIFEHQAVQFKLADMATQIEAARQLIWHAASAEGRRPPCLKEAAMAKLFASEMAERVCSAAIQVFGGYGYVSDFPVERIYRDVRVCQIYEGTSEVQKILIGRALALGRAAGDSTNPRLLWAQHALPLSIKRWSVLLHAAAAALGLGLIASLYLRGLVLDYRAGWESTFLDAASVQQLLNTLLGPAALFTGVAVPDVAPLQLAPGVAAQASAAPWIHLYGATLLLAVVLPRTVLALLAAARARWQARHFTLPLDTPYFESLAPLMQPRLPRAVRLLWAAPGDAGAAPLQLFGTTVPAPLPEPLLLLQSDEGDQLVLHPAPLAELQASTQPLPPMPWWQPWKRLRDPSRQLLVSLQSSTEAVLLLQAPGSRPPAWLATLARPVVVLQDGPVVGEAQALNLQDLADGWLPQGRLMQALQQALPGDARLQRLASSWQGRQQVRLDEGAALVAQGLALMASTRVPLADNGLLARKADAEAARTALAETLQAQWQEALAPLLAWGHQQPHGGALVVSAQAAAPHAVLRTKVGEGRAAMVGGVLTGALAGLKADVLSGGLTMGAGLVAGGVLGALGGAGVARGLNVVRGADSNFAAWDETAMDQLTQALLGQHLASGYGVEEAAAQAALQPALAALQPAFNALWRNRYRGSGGSAPASERDVLARELQPLLASAVKRALGGP
jgi:hypothetical protein